MILPSTLLVVFFVHAIIRIIICDPVYFQVLLITICWYLYIELQYFYQQSLVQCIYCQPPASVIYHIFWWYCSLSRYFFSSHDN